MTFEQRLKRIDKMHAVIRENLTAISAERRYPLETLALDRIVNLKLAKINEHLAMLEARSKERLRLVKRRERRKADSR